MANIVIRMVKKTGRPSYIVLGCGFLVSSLALASPDPTAPLGFSPGAKAAAPAQVVLPELQSILCSQTCNAIVNNTVVQSGDSIDGYRVTAVNESVVKLARGGQHWELTLFSQDIKQ